MRQHPRATRLQATAPIAWQAFPLQATRPVKEACINHTLSNRLLKRLEPSHRQALLDQAELVELTPSTVLGEGGAPQTHAYFPTSSMVSLLAPALHHKRLNLGLTGHEGVYGGASALGIFVSAFGAEVTAAGMAWKIEATRLARLGCDHPQLVRLISQFLHVELRQLGLQTLCNHFHPLQERLARCLLMSQDRMRSRDIWLTHEQLAHMLGARRAGVTEAAGQLQQQGLINYNRGHIFIADRPALQQASCTCYQQGRAMYETGLGRAA